MKVLFIGGTGNISTAVSKLAVSRGIDLYHLNRGTRAVRIAGVTSLNGDIQNFAETQKVLKDHQWDVVVNWVAFTPEDIKRDIELFRNSAKQYIFISSASAYQKPLQHYLITEDTPLENPFWQYSRDKIACENLLMDVHRTNGFPVTIVRPSLTYGTVIPVPFGGWEEYTIIDRIKNGREIIVHGDGASLWTITHASDFAKGFVGLLGNEKSIGEAFHITSDEVLTWDQIHHFIASAIGKVAKIVHMASDFICKIHPDKTGSLLGDKAVSAVFDNSKIKDFVPDFEATIPFSEGIAQTIRWIEEKPERMVIKESTHQMIDDLIAQYKKAY